MPEHDRGVAVSLHRPAAGRADHRGGVRRHELARHRADGDRRRARLPVRAEVHHLALLKGRAGLHEPLKLRREHEEAGVGESLAEL